MIQDLLKDVGENRETCPGGRAEPSSKIVFKISAYETSMWSLVTRERPITSTQPFLKIAGLFGCERVKRVFVAAEYFFIVLIVLRSLSCLLRYVLCVTTIVLPDKCSLT